MKILIDTGFLFALEVKNDRYHERAIELSDNLKLELHNYYTSSLVVNETYTLMNARTKGNSDAISKLNQLFWSNDCFFEIIYFLENDYKLISEIISKYSTPKKILSFADASLIFLKNLLNCEAIISFDKHFDGIIKRL